LQSSHYSTRSLTIEGVLYHQEMVNSASFLRLPALREMTSSQN